MTTAPLYGANGFDISNDRWTLWRNRMSEVKPKPTKFEELNSRYGTKVFATQLNVFGLPVGKWAYPTFTIEQKGIWVYRTVGTYHVMRDNVIIPCSEFTQVSFESFDPMDNEEKFHELMKILVSRLEQFKLA